MHAATTPVHWPDCISLCGGLLLIKEQDEHWAPSGLAFLGECRAMDDPPAAGLRLFLGIWPTAGVLEALQQHAAAWSWPPSARRSRPERTHLTLHFLGDVPAARLPELRQALAEAWQPCELLLDRPQVWGGGIAVLEAAAVPPELARLHAVLGERLSALGLPVEERRFRPHVTLARKAFGARPPPRVEPVPWPLAPPHVLVQSLPGGRGYLPLQEFG
jgi:RNA 2',3'-cyclic 3'-phosphodiesterase